jgi:hypothetical protein
MKSIINLTMASIVIASVSCTKSNTDNNTGIALSFKAKTSLLAGLPASDPVTKGAAAGFTFSEALIGIKQIELKREEEEFSDSAMVHNPMNKHKFDFEGSYLVDLLAGTSTPDIGFTDFVPGTYNKFESETAQLIHEGKTVSVIGTYTDPSSKVYNFNFSTKAEFEFEFESDSGFVLTQGKIMEMLINFNLPLLFNSVDFSKATVNATGVILIDETNNAELYKKIKHNIHSAGEMHEDHEMEMEHKHGM